MSGIVWQQLMSENFTGIPVEAVYPTTEGAYPEIPLTVFIQGGALLAHAIIGVCFQLELFQTFAGTVIPGKSFPGSDPHVVF